MKEETVTPPKGSLVEQQVAFDCFREQYNWDRPHEALAGQTPATLYRPSLRPYPARLPEMTYPEHLQVRRVRPRGSIRWQGSELFISEALIGEPVALEQISDHLFQIYYGPVLLTTYDEKKAKLVGCWPQQERNIDTDNLKCYLCDRSILLPMCRNAH